MKREGNEEKEEDLSSVGKLSARPWKLNQKHTVTALLAKVNHVIIGVIQNQSAIDTKKEKKIPRWRSIDPVIPPSRNVRHTFLAASLVRYRTDATPFVTFQ